MKNSAYKKVVIITGSGSGIGKATALLFCQNGFSVMLNGRSENKIKNAADELIALGHDASFFTGDVTDYETCKEMIAHTIKIFGKLNVLITNASISMNMRFDEMNPEFFKNVFNSNVYGAVMPLFASLESLKQSKGSVIFIGSVGGFHGVPTASAYCAGKMALTAIQQSVGSELHSSGVHVGILYVGFTENDSDKKLLSSSGEWMPVPKRPRLFQQSQNDVAKSILRMVRRRTNKKTCSLIGISTELTSRFAPWLINSAVALSQKKYR